MSHQVIEANLLATGMKTAIVAGRFNELFVDKLVGGALDALVRHGADAADQTVVWVPGGWELPLAAKKLAATGKYDAVIALGAVIRGSTPHFDYVAGEAQKGLARVAEASGIPVTSGLLTVDSLEQAMERSGTKMGNKGWEASTAAIEMVNLLKAIG